MTDFTLPELGEQIEAGDVLRVLVKAGDTLTKEQPVLELETDKATIEVPSSVAGTVMLRRGEMQMPESSLGASPALVPVPSTANPLRIKGDALSIRS